MQYVFHIISLMYLLNPVNLTAQDIDDPSSQMDWFVVELCDSIYSSSIIGDEEAMVWVYESYADNLLDCLVLRSNGDIHDIKTFSYNSYSRKVGSLYFTRLQSSEIVNIVKNYNQEYNCQDGIKGHRKMALRSGVRREVCPLLKPDEEIISLIIRTSITKN